MKQLERIECQAITGTKLFQNDPTFSEDSQPLAGAR
jgi:hypothetical protein